MSIVPFETERREILQLRARIVVLERATLAALELALRVRPEELDQQLEFARQRLVADYEEESFAIDVTNKAERQFLADEVERLMRGLQSEMGFKGGIAVSENG